MIDKNILFINTSLLATDIIIRQNEKKKQRHEVEAYGRGTRVTRKLVG